MTLSNLGWSHDRDLEWQVHPLKNHGTPARVISTNRNFATIIAKAQKLSATIPSQGSALEHYPAVGDWCVIANPEPATTQTKLLAVLSRWNQLRRKRAGKATTDQVIACNMDWALMLTSRGEEFSLNRIERYLSMILTERIKPIICLTKADLDPAWTQTESAVQRSFPDVPVLSLSAHTGLGLERLETLFTESQTSILLGSSGVGKSTLTNRLLDHEIRRTQPIRELDSKGRHTTSNSRMFRVPRFGWIIDVPGLREIEPWDAREGIDEAFAEIHRDAQGCRFRNCTHQNEPGCAVTAAIESGLLAPRTIENYDRMVREQQFQSRKAERQPNRLRKQKDKSIAKELRGIIKRKRQ